MARKSKTDAQLKAVLRDLRSKKVEDIEDVIRMGVRVAVRYRKEGIMLRWTLHYDPETGSEHG